MRTKRLLLMLCLVVAMGVQSAMAWGGFGHGCMVYVAEQHLTPEAKEKCQYYLRHSLAYYASWMDSWRGSLHFKSVNGGHSNKTTKDGYGIITKKGAMGHLVKTLNELGNGNYKNLPDSVVRQRLINLIHYLPDMHCPSHCKLIGGRDDAAPKVIFKGKTLGSFHGFYDSMVSRIYGKNKKPAELAAELDTYSKAKRKKICKGDHHDWAKECMHNTHVIHQWNPNNGSGEVLDDTVERSKDLIDMQLRLAGYRLAHLLNKYFGK